MLTRKQFLGAIACVLGTPVLAACGEDRDRATPDAAPEGPDAPDAEVCMRARCVDPVDAAIDAPPAGVCSSTSAVVGDNHGHAVTVSEADIAAGVEKTYDIQGQSDHPHAIRITAAMFAQLKTHMAITVTSSEDDGHAHDVVVTCAA